VTLIALKNAELAFGLHPLLDGASLAIQAGDRVGLIGRNGTGKSSLLGALLGTLPLDDGEVQRRPGLSIASVEQEPLLPEVMSRVARLGPVFDEWFERFLAERGPRSHYLRDVTTEFLEFFSPLAASDERIPPWAVELARHEALDIVVGSLAETNAPGVAPALDPDRGLAFVATARVVRYDHAVHRLSSDLDDRSAPERTPTALFVYRSPEHDVRYLELTPLAAAILEALLAGATLREALESGTRELGVRLDGTVLDGTARVLADLAERGAALGARDGAPGDLPNARDPAENGAPLAPRRDQGRK